MNKTMQLIYTGLEQIIHPKSDEHVPITRPSTTIQVVYSGFEQLDSLLFGENYQEEREVKTQESNQLGMLMFNH